MEEFVRAICRQEGLEARAIERLSGGQVNQVFLVDGTWVVRIGERAGAYERLRRETEILRSLAGQVPVPQVAAFGELNGRVYQVQQRLPGKKLYRVWPELSHAAQEGIAVQLAAHLKVLHSRSFAEFGGPSHGPRFFASWEDFLVDKFNRSLAEIAALNLRMYPGSLELAQEYFDEHRTALRGGSPSLVHSDLHLLNMLVEGETISALLDFEHALQAPPDYELWTMEAFCLYPNDSAEEDNETCCSADYANFCRLLQKHTPELCEIPRLRERLNLYQLDATLGSYLAWRRQNLAEIPPERMAAKGFYLARFANFTFRNGTHLFCG